MSTEPRQFSLGNIERYVFRPLFVFLTFIMVLLAIVQASGRFAMYALYLFDSEVNAVLVSRQIDTNGLEGDWRGLNPVLRIDSVSFPAGVVAGVEVEIDLLESMLRSALIPQRVYIASADVHLEQTDSGWQLRDMVGENDIDVTQMLRHVDDLAGLLKLHLAGLDGSYDVLQARVALVNRGGLHYGKVLLDNAAAADLGFEAEVWQRERVSFVQPPVTAALVSGDLLVPSVLSGMPGLTLSFDNTQWLELDRQGVGSLSLGVDGVQLPESAAELSVSLIGVAEQQGLQLRGMSTNFSVAVLDDQLALGPVYLDVVLNEAEQFNLAVAAELLLDTPPEPMLSLWLAQLQLDELTQFFTAHLGGFKPASLWVQGLSVAGEANNVHVFYDPELGLGYEASIADLAMQGYKGVPTLNGIQARLWGYERGAALQLRSVDAFVQFPTLFHQGWDVTDVQGVVKAWFGDGYFGLQGSHIKARLDDTAVAGGFALARPTLRSEQRLSLQLHVDEVGVVRAKSFVPFNVPQGLADWIARGPQQGQLVNAQYASHGQIRVSPGELGRRIELTSDLRDAAVEYDPAWPIVRGVEGHVHVAGTDTRVAIASGISQLVVLRESNLVLHNNASYVTGELDVVGSTVSLLDFVRSSPLKENLSFITPGWQGTGELSLRGNLIIPIKAEASPELAVDLSFDLDKVSLAMPDYRIVVHDLLGKGEFSLPHYLSGEFTGRLFGRPAEFRSHYDDEWLRFDINGSATPADAYAILDSEPRFPASGEFEFESVLNLAMSGGVTNLTLTSDLVGLQVELPGEFAKAETTPVPGELDIQFLAEYQSVRWLYKNVNGWLHYSDRIERGALGIAEPPPMTAHEEQAILIAGYMPRLVLDDWVPTGSDSGVGLPLDWTIQDLRVGQFVIGEMSFAEVVLDGAQRGEDLSFVLDSPTLKGKVDIPGADIMLLNIAYLKIDDPDAGFEEHIGAPQQDPVSVEVGRSLPAAKVNIDQLDIGDEPFGSWQFTIEPEQDRVLFSDFSADVNGVHIVQDALVWDLSADQSTFSGRLVLDDLIETLPKWDYAASMTTDTAEAEADITWPGSPLNINILSSNGDLKFSAADGRFVEVESGTSSLRILGLLNFTKIAQRINFDFSDVVGEGLGFEKIEASIRLQDGQLTFPERMLVDTSSGNFQVGGRVDLRTGELDNEMIVTLPVSKSLPWYGVYLALANPLVGIGVVVGERMLRKPIEQFSTAKFEVSGTFDDPKVNFVSLFDQSMKPASEPKKPAVEAAQESPPGDAESVLGVPTAQFDPEHKE